MNKYFKWVAALAVVLVSMLVLLPDRSGKTSWKLPAGPGKPAVAIGISHGVILASDGSLWTWGESMLGWQVLGLGNNVRTQSYLRRIGQDTNWVNIAVGGSTTLALKSDGTIWAWGENLYGQLGEGTMIREQASPVRPVAGNNWKQVATAGPHSVALKTDGTLWSWGNNWAGQLGDGTTNHSRVPLRVGTSTNWTKIWANLIQNVGQQTDGTLWFWGWDYTRSEKGCSVPVPTRVSPDTNWVDVGMGDWMVFAIKSDGSLWAWGRQAHIYTGANNPDADASPVQVSTGNDWRACAQFCNSYPLFLKRDGSLWAMDGADDRNPRGIVLVTAILTGLATNNHLQFVANNATLGGDPASGVVKNLQITFRLGGETNRTVTYRENCSVNLGGTGETLAIIRALYGDPKLFSNADTLLLRAPVYPRAGLKQIQLPTNIVAFCGGRHALGAALTSDGEVWTWGEALGRRTPAIPPLQFCSRLLNRVGVPVQLGDPRPVILKQPSKLRKDAPP